MTLGKSPPLSLSSSVGMMLLPTRSCAGFVMAESKTRHSEPQAGLQQLLRYWASQGGMGGAQEWRYAAESLPPPQPPPAPRSTL